MWYCIFNAFNHFSLTLGILVENYKISKSISLPLFFPIVLFCVFLFCVCSESQRPANKRRKRKGSTSGGVANNAPPAPNKKRSPGPNFSLASQVIINEL